MCRWLVYSGSPVPLEAFLYQPEHSLIDQSLNAKLVLERKETEITFIFAAAAAFLLVLSLLLSFLWFNRSV